MQEDLDYYGERLLAELEQATLAPTEEARAAHRKLADLYRAKLKETDLPAYSIGLRARGITHKR